MNRILLWLVGFIVYLSSHAQIPLYYSSGPNISTCRNGVIATIVPNRDLNSQELDEIDYDLFNSNGYYYYLGIQTSDIISTPTTYYNCHAYAWHLTEGNNNQVWIDRGTNDSNLGKYWDSNVGCFKEVAFESSAEKIYYYTGDHSAVKSSIAGKYESKWGSSYVIRHFPNQVPYSNPSNRRYYVYTSILSGSSNVCPSGTTFTITNPPPVDSIVWSCGPNLAISLGQNPEECTIVRTGNGNSWIRARLVNGCGAVVLEKNIPAIDPPTVSISTYPETPPCLNTEYSFYATASGSCQPYSYKWFVDNKEVGHNSSELHYTFEDDEWYNSQTVPVYCRVYFAGDSVTSPVLYKTIIDCYQPITASISGDATVCLNDEGHWAATVSGGSQNYIYDWYINQDDNLHFLSETLDYYFSASEWSSRPLSIGLRVTDVITNVQAYANPYYSWLSNCGRRSYSVKVAPNPASDYVDITVSEEINPENFLPSSNKNSTGFSSENNTDTKKPFSEEVLTYTISDNNGKPFLPKKTAEKKLAMPVSGYFPGVYILTVTSSTEKVTQQILISR